MKHLLVFDLSNLCYMGAATVSKQEAATVDQYFEASVAYLRSQYRYFKPDTVIFACDHEEQYWRTALYPEYKANRVDNPFRQKVREVIKRFKIQNQKLCLEYPSCEADDVIYALCEYTDFHVTIVSSDGDFEQLLRDRVRVFNPSQFAFRLKPKDVAFNLFVKCIRGDRGDNVPAALPMITLKRLREAYRDEDPIRFLQKHYRFSPELQEQYQLNRTLIDFNAMPDALKEALKREIVRYFELP